MLGNRLKVDASPVQALPVFAMDPQAMAHADGYMAGKAAGQRGERNCAYRTGRYTAEAKAERRYRALYPSTGTYL